MKRREFVKNTTRVAVSMMAVPGFGLLQSFKSQNDPALMGHPYQGGSFLEISQETIRQDLDHLLLSGIKTICLEVNPLHPEKLDKAVNFIIEEAHKRGMKVNILLGKVVLNGNFYHKKDIALYKKSVEKMIDLWTPDGFIWQEPAAYRQWAFDYYSASEYHSYLQDKARFVNGIKQTVEFKQPQLKVILADEVALA